MDLDFAGIDFSGYERDEILSALVDALLIGGVDDVAEFYSPDQPRDERGRFAEGATLTPSIVSGRAAQAVDGFLTPKTPASGKEVENLASHLARLTPGQLRQVRTQLSLPPATTYASALAGKLARAMGGPKAEATDYAKKRNAMAKGT